MIWQLGRQAGKNQASKHIYIRFISDSWTNANDSDRVSQSYIPILGEQITILQFQ